MTYKQITSDKVNEFLEEVSKRNSKINEKLNELDSQINSLSEEISKEQQSVVEYDLKGDATSKKNFTKEIGELKFKLNDLIQEKAAYVEARKRGNALKEKAEKLHVVANKEIDHIHILIAKKREGISKLELQKNQIEQDINCNESEMRDLECIIYNIENSQIPKIDKYISEQEGNKVSDEERAPKKVTAYVKNATNDPTNPYYIQQF